MADTEEKESENMPVRHEIGGYWALSPKNRKRIDSMLGKLIEAREGGKKDAEDDKGSIPQGD